MIAPKLLADCNRDFENTADAVTRPLQGATTIAKVAALLAISLAAYGCGPSAAEQKAKLDDVQKKADDHYATMEKQYKDQLAAAQKAVDDCQQKLNDATTQAKAEAQKEAEEEVSKAHAEADKLAAEAAKALARARSAYTDTERQNFVALSKEFEELRTKATKAPAKTKPQIDKAMKDVVAKREAAAKEIPEISKASLETLRVAKAKVDQKMAVLKQAIHSLRARLA